VQAPRGSAGYIVASLERGGGERKELFVWMRRAEPDDNEGVQLSNANLLTSETLARMAREVISREALNVSPANSSAR
ncbi:MAG: hypothetical protein ACKOEG_07960, partial [Chthoniobacterales bacterium]